MIIQLVSNASLKNFPSNKVGDFINQFSSEIDLGNGRFEVALSKIIFPKTWEFLNDDDRSIKVYRGETRGTVYELMKIDQNHFTNIESLLDNINGKISSLPGGIVFSLDKNGKVFLSCFSNLFIEMSVKMQAILGFSQNEVIIPKLTKDVKKSYYTFSENMPDLNAGMHSIFVYTDLVESQVVGDTKAPLLSIIATTGKPNSHIVEEPKTLDFIPIRSNKIWAVSVSLRDINGRVIRFESGVVILTLHIRKQKDSTSI